MTTRHIIASERSILEAELAKARGYRDRNLRLLLGPTVTLLAVLAGLWTLLTGLARTIFSVDMGRKSQFAPWIVALGLVIVAWLIGLEVLKIVRRSESRLRDVAVDLSAGIVEEHELNLVEAKRFQELEHGGFMYFLLTKDGRVYVQFDYESQDLGVEGKTPTMSTYLPRTTLRVVRAPKSALILTSAFSGAPLEVSGTKVLAAKPAKWPESDAFCSIPWSDLESTFAA